MIVDAAKTNTGETIDADVCIVGSGAAGVTLALTLARSGQKVVLLEAGGLRRSKASQDFLRGDSVGQRNHPLDELRQRQLGGTTSAWGGRCIPFDPIDFEKRNYIENSGWPVSYKEIARYYPDALKWCHAGPAVFDAEEASVPELIAGFKEGDVRTSLLERWSLPTDFGKEYREELRTHPNIRVFINAPCTDILLDDRHRTVAEVVFTGSEQTRVRANNVVLSAGGLEIPRLLLACRSQMLRGIGNDFDQVGRYYMGHLVGVVSEVALNEGHTEVHENYSRDHGVYVRRRITLDEIVQKERELPNLGALLHYPLIDNPAHRNALLSAIFFAKNISSLNSRIPRSILGPELADISNRQLVLAHLRNLLVDAPSLLKTMPAFAYRRFLVRRRIPSLIPPNQSGRYPLFYHAEQTPDPKSRITLADSSDNLGMPRLKVDFQVKPGDIDRVYRAHQAIGAWLEKTGVGQLRFLNSNPANDIASQFAGGDGHFIGTTRMGNNPSNSVVTKDCNIHRVHNLYVAGSAVFPTSGQANPTLTIVAMALRLGDHLTGKQISEL